MNYRFSKSDFFALSMTILLPLSANAFLDTGCDNTYICFRGPTRIAEASDLDPLAQRIADVNNTLNSALTSSAGSLGRQINDLQSNLNKSINQLQLSIPSNLVDQLNSLQTKCSDADLNRRIRQVVQQIVIEQNLLITK